MNTLATNVFEEDVDDQVIFYLAAAVALKALSAPGNYQRLISLLPPEAANHLTTTRLDGMATLSKNTAQTLMEESQEGMYYEDNRREL